MDILDRILEQANKELPQFNEYLLNTYKKETIDNRVLDYVINFCEEAVRLFNGDVKLVSCKELSPIDRINSVYVTPKFASSATVDVTLTDLKMVEFVFEAWGEVYKVPMFLPYLVDGAICLNGARYYPIFPLTDSVFYHISKENGIGIKVLTSHLKFCKNKQGRVSYTSLAGNTYMETLIITQIHRKNHKYLADDLKPCIFIYFLAKYGFVQALEMFGLSTKDVDFIPRPDTKDTKYEYFEVRPCTEEVDGLYMKVKSDIIGINPSADILQSMSIVFNIRYCLDYFVKVQKTAYNDNTTLIKELKETVTPWRIILGKTIYGINHQSELQVLDHAKVHLESLDLALDIATKNKLTEVDIYVNNAYELLKYVFENMDQYIINHVPSDLYNKRINILDLLLGNVVQAVFQKIYKKTNNRKNGEIVKENVKDIGSIFRPMTRAFYQIHKCSQVVAGNPATYNDNRLLAVGLRKVRATHSPNSGGTRGASGKGGAGKQSINLVNSPQHRMHTSWLVVESISDVSTQNPGIAGSINSFLKINKKGVIQKPDNIHELDELDGVLLTK